MINHVRTANWGTTNTIPQVKHQVIYVIYNLIKCSWLLSLYGGTVCVSYIIDSGHRRRRVFYVLNEDVAIHDFCHHRIASKIIT